MNDLTTTQCLLFPGILTRLVVPQFDQRQGNSDGGAILLGAADRRSGLTAALAASLEDAREPGKVQHELVELLTQRVLVIACGYADANDAARLAADPVHESLVGRDPVEGEDLASQPRLSRFENGRVRRQLFRLTEALADCVIERHGRRLHGRARRITIDLDPTDDPTHGAQQLSFFNGHYDSWCYLPMVGFLTFNDEAEQYLVTAVLRPGNAHASRGEIENRIKELHDGMQIGRSSCSNFWANAFRVVLTAAAYVLLQELRLRLARTGCARAQVATLRERLLKLGARVMVSVRRIVLHLPRSFPYLTNFRRLALSLGALSG